MKPASYKLGGIRGTDIFGFQTSPTIKCGAAHRIAHLELMGFALEERRAWRRYRVNWPVRVTGMYPTGADFDETGILDNLSPKGAFTRLEKALPVGTKVAVSIKLPFQDVLWMQFAAEIVRVESTAPKLGVALKFYSAKPIFG